MHPVLEERFGYSWHLLRRSHLTMLGLAIVGFVALSAIVGPFLAPYPGDAGSEVHPDRPLLPPSPQHPFGTDELGRDVFSRVLFGARISLTSSLVVVGLALLIGLPVGLVAGYFGGWIDEVLMRACDVVMSFPPLLLSVAIASMLGPSLPNAVIAIALSWWPWYARLIRSEALSVRERGFVEAARAGGVRTPVILYRHILPNSVAPVVVQASMDFGSVVLTLAALGFLGLGAQPPTPEWGLMVNSGRAFFLNQWWYSTFPGLAVGLTALGFNLLGDGLRELSNPRLREE